MSEHHHNVINQAMELLRDPDPVLAARAQQYLLEAFTAQHELLCELEAKAGLNAHVLADATAVALTEAHSSVRKGDDASRQFVRVAELMLQRIVEGERCQA